MSNHYNMPRGHIGKVETVDAELEEHKAQVGISFHDDGASLICQRNECMERQTVGVLAGGFQFFHWQRDLPYMCTPEVAVGLRDKHLRGGDW